MVAILPALASSVEKKATSRVNAPMPAAVVAAAATAPATSADRLVTFHETVLKAVAVTVVAAAAVAVDAVEATAVAVEVAAPPASSVARKAT